MLLRNPFVQVLPLEVRKIGRKQPAIAFNVSPMAPHSDRMESIILHLLREIFHNRLFEWGSNSPRVAGSNERSSPGSYVGRIFSAPNLHFLPGRTFAIFCRELVAKPWYTLLAEPTVPIGQLLEHQAFSPEDVKVLVGAYADTLRALNLADRDDQLKMTVAKLIIEFAGEGELDPTRLRDLVVKALRPE